MTALFLDESVQTVGQVKDTQFDLKSYLSKYNVPDRVYNLLCDESITFDELMTFRVKDLDEWCDEHSLKIIERRRFLNSIKSLVSSQCSKYDKRNTIKNIDNIEPEEINNEVESDKAKNSKLLHKAIGVCVHITLFGKNDSSTNCNFIW